MQLRFTGFWCYRVYNSLIFLQNVPNLYQKKKIKYVILKKITELHLCGSWIILKSSALKKLQIKHDYLQLCWLFVSSLKIDKLDFVKRPNLPPPGWIEVGTSGLLTVKHTFEQPALMTASEHIHALDKGYLPIFKVQLMIIIEYKQRSNGRW